MNQAQNYQAIPFDRVLEQQMSNQIPNPPQIGVPLDANYLYQLNTALIQAIQQSARKSPIRAYVFNMLSHGWYSNYEYAGLFETLALFAYRLQNANIDQLITMLLNAEAYRAVQSNPAIQTALSPQQQNDLMTLQQVCGQVQQLVQQCKQQNNQYAGHVQGGGYNQYNQTQSMGQGVNQHYGGGMQPQNHRTPATYGNYQQNTTQGGRGGSRPGRGNEVVGGQTPTASSDSYSRIGDRYGGDVSPQQLNAVPDSMMNVGTGPKTDFSSSNRFSSTMDKPFPSVQKYNSDWDYFCPVIKFDQIIIKLPNNQKTIITKDDTMNYDDHETDKSLVKLSRGIDNGAAVSKGIKFEQIKNPTTIKPDTALDDIEALGDHKPVYFNHRLKAYSIEHAQQQAEDMLVEIGMGDVDNRVLEYDVDIISPASMDEDMVNRLRYVQQSETLTELIDRFNELAVAEEGVQKFPPKLWYRIHDKMVKVVNYRVEAGLGRTDVKITALNTVPALLEYLDDKGIPSQTVTRWKQNLRTFLIKGVLQYDTESYSGFFQHIVVTHIPWSSEELELQWSGSYGLLDDTVTPDLVDAVQSIHKRTNDKNRAALRRFILTADDILLELHLSDIGNRSILVSKIKHR